MHFPFSCFIALLGVWAMLSSVMAAHVPYNSLLQTDTCIFAMGGSTDGGDTGDIDLISLATNFHTKTYEYMPLSSTNFGSVFDGNNTFYLVGGDWVYYFWFYDIQNNQWAILPNFLERARDTTLVDVNGTLVAMGGSGLRADGSGAFGQLEGIYVYDTKANQSQAEWKLLGNAPTDSAYTCCSVVINGSIYHVNAGSLYRSDNVGQNWTTLAPLNTIVFNQTCASLGDDLLLVVGGLNDDGETGSLVQAYNITSDKWLEAFPSMTQERAGHAAVLLPGEKPQNILVCGGVGRDDCETYDAKAGEWTAAPYVLDMPRSTFGMFIAQTPWA